MPDIVQQVGAIAGIFALLGVAFLTMLCFSMARDLRRLREWAGGAPERDAEMQEVTEAVAAERAEELALAAEREGRRQERAGYYSGTNWDRLGDRLGRGGRMVAVVAVVILLGAVAAYAATSLVGDDGGGGGTSKRQHRATVNPGQVTVAVLNGTAVDGVADEYADELQKDGFRRGPVSNATSSYTTSAVMFKPNRKRQAKAVAKSIGIGNVQPITSNAAENSGGADVVVVVGLDKASTAPGT